MSDERAAPLDFEQELRLAVSVPDADAQFLSQLRRQVLNPTPQPQSHPWYRVFVRRPALVVAITALVLVATGMMVAGPQNVWAAVQRLIGFIPGVGFVDTTQPVLVLAGPVEARQGDVTVRVSSAVSDGKSTVIDLQVDGLAGTPRQAGASDKDQVTLKSADGSTLGLNAYEVNLQPPYAIRLIFEPLPQGAREALLSFTTLPGILPGAGPEGWQLDLAFEPNAEIVAQGSPLGLESAPANGIVLSLLSVSSTPERTAIQVRLRGEDPHTYVSLFGTDALSLEDARGGSLALEGLMADPLGEDTYTLTTSPLIAGQKYTLRLSGPIQVSQMLDRSGDGPRFDLDLGSNPQIGEHWNLDETLSIGDKRVHLIEARLNEAEGGWAAQLDFQAEDIPQEIEARISPVDYPNGEASGAGNMFVLFKTIPHDQVTFEMVGVDYLVDGTWVIEWVAP